MSDPRSRQPLDLSRIFKAYDVRGVVPEELDADVARAIGTAFARLARADGAGEVVTAHDMRASSPLLARAFAAGVTGEGLDVLEIGLASTDMLYFASGKLSLPGAVFTASHNPAKYNGVKLCRAGAAPIGRDSGLADIRATTEAIMAGGQSGGAQSGVVRTGSLLTDYASYLRSLVDLSGIRPLRVVVDAGNGMGGHTVPVVLGDTVLPALPLEIVPLYFELDGTFPNHEADPMNPANLVDLREAVRHHGADIGLAFDGDADRCFVADERGEPVTPSAVTAMVAVRELAKYPGAAIIYNCITSRAVPETVTEHGGTPIRTKVGHSFIKAEMARTGAVFGGEHSAHYYFRDFWRADTGMLVAMHMLALLGTADRPLSEVAAEYDRYPGSGEINLTVDDPLGTIGRIRSWAVGRGLTLDELDGLTVDADGWWANLRPSNTEPVLRLNIEGSTAAELAAAKDTLLGLVSAAEGAAPEAGQ